MAFPTRTTQALIGLGSFAAVGFALYSQHQMGMQPCPWCILQRIVFLAIGAVSLLSALQPSGLLRRVLSLPVLALAGGGVAAAWWQHFVAAKSQSCALTFADKVIGFFGADTRFPEVFEVRASCADAAVNLLGVPYEFWSMALFALIGLLALMGLLTRTRRR
jgi:protein dithiol:quinone oxidoreductase